RAPGRGLDARRCARRGRPAHPAVRPPPAHVVPARPSAALDRRRAKSRTPRACDPGNLDRFDSGPGMTREDQHRMALLHLSKLHATGNDFLVRLALDDTDDPTPTLDPRAAAALCDRHRGIGADGFITVAPGRAGADCTMTLLNADGGAAEMS